VAELQREAVAQAVLWVPTLFVALALLIFFLILSRLAHFGVLRIVQRTRAHGPLGVNITGIVAGLGLTGFPLGFALKDSIANLLAGVLILLYRPFEVGDRLDAESERVLVPNSKMLTDPIKVSKPATGGAV
jgi:hypothetical protein